MLKQTALLLTAGTLVALVGCGSENTDIGTTEAFRSGLTCNSSNGVQPTKAALAVAMATELGELNPVAQLEVVNRNTNDRHVALRSVVASWCDSHGGCPRTRGLLALQDPSLNPDVPYEVFNATTFTTELIAALDRQVDWEHNLLINAPWQLPAAHSLTEVGVTDLGACGVHHVFNAFAAGCSDTTSTSTSTASAPSYQVLYASWDSDGTNNIIGFQVHVRAGNSPVNLNNITIRYLHTTTYNHALQSICFYSNKGCPNVSMTNSTIDVKLQGGTLAAGDESLAVLGIHYDDWANFYEWNDPSFRPDITWPAVNSALEVIDTTPTSTTTTTSSGTCDSFGDATSLQNRMKVFGWPDNPFLDVRVDGNQISIDPDQGDDGTTSSTSGACTTTSLCRVYDPNRIRLGLCCLCNGYQRTWRTLPTNRYYLYCR